MKTLVYGMMMAILLSLTNCKTQNLNNEENSEITFKKAEYQKWAAGIQGGGAGYNLVLQLENDKNTILDSVYFRKWKVKLNRDNENDQYIAIINDGSNNEVLSPSGTTSTTSATEISTAFQLEEKEAMVSYMRGEIRKYHKVVLSPREPFENSRY